MTGALRRHLPGYRVRGAESGLQLLIELPPGTDVTAIIRAAARRSIKLCDPQPKPGPSDPGLPVGYGNIKDTAIDESITTLAEIINPAAGPANRHPE